MERGVLAAQVSPMQKINKKGENIDISYVTIKNNKTLAEFIPEGEKDE